MPLKLSPSQRRKTSHLAIEQTIYVPSTMKGGKKVAPSTLYNRTYLVKKYLAKKFGGYTSIEAKGGYQSKKRKRLVKEKVTKVTSFASKRKFNKNKDALLKQLRRWGKKWGQESMGYEHEGDMYHIKSGLKKKIKKKMRRKK